LPAVWAARPSVLQAVSAWMALLLCAMLAVSLAWAGHGADGGSWHLCADALHLLVSGAWPAGLLPFTLLLFKLKRAPEPGRDLAVYHLARRFSIMSLTSVCLLTATGLANSWVLVGSWHNFWHTSYGRMLGVKIALFIPMVALGAVNMFYLKPRLTTDAASSAAARLRWNVSAEVVLGTLVIIAVAILGLLPPGTMCDCGM